MAITGYRRFVGLKVMSSGTFANRPLTASSPVMPGKRSPTRARYSSRIASRP